MESRVNVLMTIVNEGISPLVEADDLDLAAWREWSDRLFNEFYNPAMEAMRTELGTSYPS